MDNSSLDFFKENYQNGIKEYKAVLSNGQNFHLRLFMSQTGILCYFPKGKRAAGYPLHDLLSHIISVSEDSKENQTVYQEYISNLKKFKKAFTEKIHANLWTEFQDSYNQLDIQDFENYVSAQNIDTQDQYELYKSLVEYCKIKGLKLNTENHYKTASVLPLYVDSIKTHLDNKTDFHYSWRGSYDFSVEGKLCNDGIYRAWFSAEYKGCGNGHYYLLINERQAVFTEDD